MTDSRTIAAHDAWSGDWSPTLVAFDLDDTLAPSKTAIDPEMGRLLLELLGVAEVCIISGGQIGQFQTQVIAQLPDATPEQLRRLHLMPTCGTQYLTWNGQWNEVYAENLTAEQISAAMTSLESRAKELGLWETDTWGPVLEDRGSQVTFSALGQAAPVEAKKAWDPTGERKNSLRAAVAADLPDLEVRSGGSTSVDITRLGIDKAYGMKKLTEMTGIPLDDMLFVGDRLDADGNDYPVKALGVKCHAVEGWPETAELLRRLIPQYAD
ncbi:HAD-IIB family hydrolase [Naasia lichenicola]|nr:HAD-IIB family hydrolase [Naasia lichenicola]